MSQSRKTGPFTGLSAKGGIRPGVDAGSGEANDSPLCLASMIVSLVHEAPVGGRGRPVNGPDIWALRHPTRRERRA